MGSGTTAQPGMDQSVTNTGLSNAFLGNQPIPQTYQPQPMSYANMAAPGSLPGLTGSLIGSSGMPALPKPTGPMPIPVPASSGAAPAQQLSRGQMLAPQAAQDAYKRMYESATGKQDFQPVIWRSHSGR